MFNVSDTSIKKNGVKNMVYLIEEKILNNCCIFALVNKKYNEKDKNTCTFRNAF